MPPNQPPATKSYALFVLYILGFLYTLHFTISAYINSSFLTLFTDEKFVGYIYTIGSIFTILGFFLIPKILKRIGNKQMFFTLLLIELFCMIGLATLKNPILVSTVFILSFIMISVAGLNFDIFLESFSSNTKTGKIRGFFLTSTNAAWIISPIIGSFILTNGDYWKIYLTSAVLIIPTLLLLHPTLKGFHDPEYENFLPGKTLSFVRKDSDIWNIFSVGFILHIFYAWMIIYTPIYLHKHIGFDWSEIGIIFSVMLLPFVLTQLPLGKLADDRLGEKEILSVGFIIIALSTAVISFIDAKSVILWSILLFITRIGASMIEIMSETYFFKKIDGNNVHVISLYRTMRPWAYLIGPMFASILFVFIPFKFIFAVLGLLMFYGLKFSLSLKDTR